MGSLFKDLKKSLEDVSKVISMEDLLEFRYKQTRWEKIWWPIESKIKGLYNFFRRDIPHGISGCIYWFPFAWKYRTWDWQYGMTALNKHLVKLEVAVREGCHDNGAKDAKDIRLALALMKRLRENDYYSKAEANPQYKWLKNESPYKYHKRQENNDWSFLFELLRKRMRHWWD